ncbi:MAG: RNA polymerase sigma factor region1.1 domain-containing protein, partial [Thermodesulfobacteriota bacterium]|nr:RNA polymerase sigma factor region1.1 domain-containing protein [Thermodesulfobacteriota bacterium]
MTKKSDANLKRVVKAGRKTSADKPAVKQKRASKVGRKTSADKPAVKQKRASKVGRKTSADKPAVKQKRASKVGRKTSADKPAVKQKRASKVGRKASADKPAVKQKRASKVSKKILNGLILKGKKKGYLTYDEINEVLNDDIFSSDQIDEALIMFNDLGIDVVDKGDDGKEADNRTTDKAFKKNVATIEFGTVADPVKMYLREMGLVTLLSREGEVEIAKDIESGELKILRAFIDTEIGVEYILETEKQIKNGDIRLKHVLRDVDEGDTYVDEV